jgi:hypothetical protein
MRFKSKLRSWLGRIKNKPIQRFCYKIYSLCFGAYAEYETEEERLKSLNLNVDDTAMTNIYGHEGKISGYLKYHHWVHNFIKFRIVLTGMNLFRRFYGNKMVKGKEDLPNMYQFQNLKLFDIAYDRTCVKWEEFFHINVKDPRRLDWHFVYECHKTCLEKLRLLHDIYLTINKNDTAYLEFHNMLMYEIAIVMKECPEHVLYTSKTINDVKYFTITGDIPSEYAWMIEFMLKSGEVYLHQMRMHPVTEDHFSDLFGSTKDLMKIPELSKDCTLVKYSELTRLNLTDVAKFRCKP